MAIKPPPPVNILRGHEGVVTALHFTNDKDGGVFASPSLISASDVGEIFIWDLKTQRTYHRLKSHNGKMILYICFINSSLISQGRDNYINIWKVVDTQWKIKKTIQASHFGFCAANIFPFDESIYLIAPSGEGHSMTFYDCETTNKLYEFPSKTPSGSSSEICMCIKAIQIDTQFYLLIGFDSGNIVLWSFKLKKELSKFKCHPDVIFCLDYDTNYKNRGISGSADNVIQVWKIENEQFEKVHQVSITNPGVTAVKIRDDGKIVITAGQDCSIRVFSWKNLKPLAVLQFHNKPISALEFCSNTKTFASGSKDKNICLWSIY